MELDRVEIEVVLSGIVGDRIVACRAAFLPAEEASDVVRRLGVEAVEAAVAAAREGQAARASE